MTTKTIQDVVTDLEWLASPAAETLTDGTRITEFCKAVHKLDLTQLVKEVEAGEREKIICSAVRYKDKVWMGHRHMHALEAMHGELSYTMSRKEMIAEKTDQDQGFVTSKGRFVDRSVGWDIAFKAGQILERKHQTEGYLYSEDLW